MDTEQEAFHLELAVTNYSILCSEAPLEILEACAADVEPTPFLEEYFSAGYSEWSYQKHGRRLPQSRINNAIVVLYNRSCRLHTNLITRIQDPDLDKHFFSDEGLYE
jgi:hypothetical protein